MLCFYLSRTIDFSLGALTAFFKLVASLFGVIKLDMLDFVIN